MSVAWARWDGADLIVSVRLQPRARKDALLPDSERFRIQITAPPVDGAANDHLTRYLADVFEVSRTQVSLVRGQTSRDKVLRIAAPRKLPAQLSILIGPR